MCISYFILRLRHHLTIDNDREDQFWKRNRCELVQCQLLPITSFGAAGQDPTDDLEDDDHDDDVEGDLHDVAHHVFTVPDTALLPSGLPVNILVFRPIELEV